jgi:hypothetical protein
MILLPQARRASLKHALVAGWSDRKSEALRLAEKIELFREAMNSALAVAAVDGGRAGRPHSPSHPFGPDDDDPVSRHPPGSTAAAIALERGRHVAIRENVDQLGEVAARLEHALSTYEAVTGEFIGGGSGGGGGYSADSGGGSGFSSGLGSGLAPGGHTGSRAALVDGGQGQGPGAEQQEGEPSEEYVIMPSAELPAGAHGVTVVRRSSSGDLVHGSSSAATPMSAVAMMREATDDLLSAINARENENLLHGLLNWFTAHAQAEESGQWTTIGHDGIPADGHHGVAAGEGDPLVPLGAGGGAVRVRVREATLADIEDDEREADDLIAQTLERIDDVAKMRASEANALKHRLAAMRRQSELERAALGGGAGSRRMVMGPGGQRLAVPTAAQHALNARRRGSIISALGTLGRDTQNLSAAGPGAGGGDSGDVADLPDEDDVIAALNAEIASLRRDRDDLRWRRAQAALRHTDAVSEHERLLHAEQKRARGLEKKVRRESAVSFLFFFFFF